MATNEIVSRATTATVIRARLDELGKSMTQLSRETGIMQSRVFKLVKGELAVRVEELPALAQALDLRLEDLVPGASS